jgi:hypothetical protein
MIALCSEHHPKADAGAFTKDQLHAMKQEAAQRTIAIKSRFDWMRNDFLAVVGGNFYHETPVAVQFKGTPVVSFSSEEGGFKLLNVGMLSSSGSPRLRVEEHFWIEQGIPEDLECPPSGKLLKAEYENGDSIRIEFFELESKQALHKRYPNVDSDRWGLPYPITAVEIRMNVAGTSIKFGPRESNIGGILIRDSFASRCPVGLAIG